jgi:hypothetical protein
MTTGLASRGRGILGLVFCAVATLGPTRAGAQLYRWVDADGVVRFTNDLATIPPAWRGSAQDIGSPQARPAGAPAPGPALPGVMTFAAGGPIHAPVLVNGVSLTLMLDTGADRTVITPAALARAGIDVLQGRAVTIVGVTGAAMAREIVVPRLDVAGAVLGPLPVIAHEVAGAGGDGLLGRDVLDAFTLQVDTAAGRAVLAPR